MRLHPVGPTAAYRAAASKGIPQPDEFVDGETATRGRHRFAEECVASGAWPRPLVGCMRLKGQILRPGEPSVDRSNSRMPGPHREPARLRPAAKAIRRT